MAETPEYTERQYSQNFLIYNSDKLLEITNRNAGFPDQTVAGTGMMGPQPVVITRVVSGNRKRDGTVEQSAQLNGDDPSTLVNAFTPEQNVTFFDVPEEVLDMLTPRVELYKSYPLDNNTEETFDVRFRPQYRTNSRRTIRDQARRGSQQTQVGITGLTIEKRGGNPAEIDSNIFVSLKISTTDLNNLFYRYKPPEARVNSSVVPALVRNNGIAWIDLIKMNPEALQGNSSCQQIYSEPDSRIKLVIGYNKVGNDEDFKRSIKEILTNNTIGRNQINSSTLQRWAAQGTPISSNFKNAVHNNQHEPIVNGNNIQSSSGTISDNKLNEKVDQIIKAINDHEEIYYLNLKNHDLIVNTDLTVELTVHFIAHGQAAHQMQDANLLDDTLLRPIMENNSKLIKQWRAEIHNINPPAPLPDSETDEAAQKRYAKEVERYNSRIAAIESRIDDLQERINGTIALRNKKLYNQMRLRYSPLSRIYVAAFPKDHNNKAFTQVNNEVMEMGSYYDRYNNVQSEPSRGTITGGGATVKVANYSTVAYGIQQQLESHATPLEEAQDVVEYDDATETYTTAIEELTEWGSYKLVRFVYMGDLLEAALEICAYNAGFTEDDSAWVLDPNYTETGEVGQAQLVDASPQGVVTSLSGLDRDKLLQIMTDDSLQYPVFSNNMERHRLGDSAQKTIQRFGKFVLGDIELPQRETDTTKRYINIADIPVDLEYVQQFWYNEVISRPNIKKYFLKNLINGILNTLIPNAITNTNYMRDGVITYDDAVRPKAILNFFTLKGDGKELNTKQSVREVQGVLVDATGKPMDHPGVPGVIGANSPGAQEAALLVGVPDDDLSLGMEDQMTGGFAILGLIPDGAVLQGYNADGGAIYTNPGGGTSTVQPSAVVSMREGIMENMYEDLTLTAEQVDEAAGYEVRPAPTTYTYVDYFSSDSVREAVSATFNKGVRTHSTDIFLIHQKQDKDIDRTGNESKDLKQGIYHFKLSAAEKKSLLNVKFNRSDLPGIAEANLLAANSENQLGILREKYDATLLMRGNCVFKPGSMLYLKPEAMQGIYLPPSKHDQDRMDLQGVLGTAARSIGLGGYYTVVSLRHDFGTLGKGGKWQTTVDSRWNSFAYSGPSRCILGNSTSPNISWVGIPGMGSPAGGWSNQNAPDWLLRPEFQSGAPGSNSGAQGSTPYLSNWMNTYSVLGETKCNEDDPLEHLPGIFVSGSTP